MAASQLQIQFIYSLEGLWIPIGRNLLIGCQPQWSLTVSQSCKSELKINVFPNLLLFPVFA